MNRRLALKQLAVATAAICILPSCAGDKKKVSIALSNLNITPGEEQMLAEFADTVIPETDTPGARTVEAHLFTLVMVNDCMEEEQRKKYVSGMRSFDKFFSDRSGVSFADATRQQRLEAFAEVESSRESLPEDIKTFYFRTKGYVVQGYTTSRHFMAEVQKFKLVPGPVYKGCVPFNSNAI